MIGETGELQSVLGDPNDCVRVDGSAGPCGTSGGPAPMFVDGEVPSGTVDGSNATFTLAEAPWPSSSLQLFRNGVLQRSPDDYTLSDNTVTFLAASIPKTGDQIQASYRTSEGGSSVSFVDADSPSGTMNGMNADFTLAEIPSPASSLQVYRNGILQRAGVDYTADGMTITFLPGSLPKAGDIIQTFYRK
jgi:hypothetical protein